MKSIILFVYVTKMSYIYIELKNWVIVPTKFPDTATATKTMNDSWSFIEINGNVYNKFQIKRTMKRDTVNEFIDSISKNSYELQEVLWIIIFSRNKEWKRVSNYRHLMNIYNSMMKSWDRRQFDDMQWYMMDWIKETDLYLP